MRNTGLVLMHGSFGEKRKVIIVKSVKNLSDFRGSIVRNFSERDIKKDIIERFRSVNDMGLVWIASGGFPYDADYFARKYAADGYFDLSYLYKNKGFLKLITERALTGFMVTQEQYQKRGTSVEVIRP